MPTITVSRDHLANIALRSARVSCSVAAHMGNESAISRHLQRVWCVGRQLLEMETISGDSLVR